LYVILQKSLNYDERERLERQFREISKVAKFKSDKTFFHGKSESMGVLLVNLGTPTEPTTSSVRKYLRQFLSDSRVIEIPRAIWLTILYVFILPRRPPVIVEKYKEVWMDDGSPLLHYTKRQAKLIQQEMESRFKAPIFVEPAMRYGEPSIESGLKALQEKGAHRILVLPLYPQYSAATTATGFDEIARVLRTWRWIPELRFVGQYHDHPAYIDALAISVKEHWKTNGQSDVLLMSFHGLPKRNLELGDPYFCQCQKTGRLLAEKLQLKDEQWRLTFQSRFGKAEWLQPYTDKTLMALPGEGVKNIDVICPGFPSDCLETLEEIKIENHDYFMEAGGESFNYIPALNDQQGHIEALSDIVQQHTQGWAETDASWDVSQTEKQNELTQQRAKAKGSKI
jgi:ferrochelatase